MKVQDLWNKEFENTNLKKLDITDRMAFAKRKSRSLQHQKNILELKAYQQILKMVQTGRAYRSDDPKFKEEGENCYVWAIFEYYNDADKLYGNFYVKNIPENQSAIKFFQALHIRRHYIREMIDKLKRSMKGLRSAQTRKDRKERWG